MRNLLWVALLAGVASGQQAAGPVWFLGQGSTFAQCGGATASFFNGGISGREAVFASGCPLEPNDPLATNFYADVYTRDATTGTTTLISTNAAGVAGNGDSLYPAMTPDGRFVVYSTFATDIITPDGNGTFTDVILVDRQTGIRELINVNSAGLQATNHCGVPDISDDGRYVVFLANSPNNLVPGGVPGQTDAYLRDRLLGTTIRVGQTANGVVPNTWTQEAKISGDGSAVIFKTTATNLDPLDTTATSDWYLFDPVQQTNTWASLLPFGGQFQNAAKDADITADGNEVLFGMLPSGLGQQTSGLWLYDRTTQVTSMVDNEYGGFQQCKISGDGRYVFAYGGAGGAPWNSSGSSNALPVRYDRWTDVIELACMAPDGAKPVSSGTELAAISNDGRMALVTSDANNLVPGVNWPIQYTRGYYLYDMGPREILTQGEPNFSQRPRLNIVEPVSGPNWSLGGLYAQPNAPVLLGLGVGASPGSITALGAEIPYWPPTYLGQFLTPGAGAWVLPFQWGLGAPPAGTPVTFQAVFADPTIPTGAVVSPGYQVIAP